jgi:hypothetical protein
MRFQNQCTELVNAIPSPVDGLIKRPPTEYVATLLDSAQAPLEFSDVFVHTINRAESERYFAVFAYNSTTDVASVNVYTVDGARIPVTLDTGAINYIKQVGLKDNLRAVTIADVTFVVNTSVETDYTAALSTYSRELTSQPQEAIVFITQVDTNREHEIILKFTSGATTETYTLTHKASGNDIGTDHTAAELENDFNVAKQNAQTGTLIKSFSVSRFSSVLFFYRASGTALMEISVSDDLATDGALLIRGEVADFSKLPPVAPHKVKVKIIGAPESRSDDYWVEFIQNSTSTNTLVPQNGYWVETNAPGIKTTLDPAKMPHILIREANGEFRFRKADGAAPYENYVWTKRLVGDDNTNTTPTFVGEKISDISVYQNRLVFLSGENVIFSETSEFFNFFRVTVADTTDADPIDISSTTPKVAGLRSILPFENQLILFSPLSQFSIQSNGPFATRTISMNLVGDYQSTATLPVSSGNSLFFPFSRGGYSGVREMVLSSRLDGRFMAEDISAVVPQYIKGSITRLVGSTHENYLACLSSGSPDEIYIYKYFQIGDNRVQSAWSKFKISSGQILDAVFIDSSLYLFVKVGITLEINRIRLDAGRVDVDSDYVTLLDRRLDEVKLASSGGYRTYDATNNETTVVLPYDFDANKIQVYTKTGVKLDVYPVAYNSFKIYGDRTQTPMWIGEKYDFRFVLSNPSFRTSSEGSVSAISGRYQMRYATIAYGTTSYFKVNAAVEYGDTYSYTFTATTLGTGLNQVGNVPLDTGKFRVPIYCNSEALTLSIESDSALPCRLISLEYEASYNERARRV